NRWRSAALIGLVLGLGSAAALAAAAGARRTDSAYPRMLARTNAPALLVSAGSEHRHDEFYRKFATVDGVKEVGMIAGVGLVPTHVAKGGGTAIEACSLTSLDGIAGNRVDRPNVVAGRLPNPARDD